MNFIGLIILFVLILALLGIGINKNHGKSVTKEVETTKQPKGGFLPLKSFEKTEFGVPELCDVENISPVKMGTVIDYMTRVLTGAPKNEIFKIAIQQGVRLRQETRVRRLINDVVGLDEQSIRSVVLLCDYESLAYSRGKSMPTSRNLTQETISNIRVMTENSLKLLAFYGGCTWSGFTFEGGYTKKISHGTGDFLTPDTLWDFKTYKSQINSKNTLQILIYWRLGVHSKHRVYKNIKYIGLYNPRTNTAYRLDVSKIPEETIRIVDKKIIGY